MAIINQSIDKLDAKYSIYQQNGKKRIKMAISINKPLNPIESIQIQ